jgi:hypothetical protein
MIFRYEIVKYIANKLLNILVYTDGGRTDILFLLRLYKTIITIPESITLGSVMICTHGEEMFTLSSSIPITPKTTPQDFIMHFYKGILKLSLKGYNVDVFDVLMVKTISGDYTPNVMPEVSKKTISGDIMPEISKKTISNARGYSTLSNRIKLDIDPDSPQSKRDSRRFILPIQPKDKRMDKLAVFDIETFVFEGKLHPYDIGLQ